MATSTLSEAFPAHLRARVAELRLVAVLIIDDPAAAPALARALLEGGVQALELTLRTDGALAALRAVKQYAPELLLGAGTVLTPAQVTAVAEAGADFAVSPGTNPRVLQAARQAGLPFAPGICTPSDIEAALQEDCRLLKYFPAETSGGLPHLEAMAAAYQHRGVQFVPLGGVKEENMLDYLKSPLVAAVGGSWIADRKSIQKGDWATIRQRAESATRKIALSKAPLPA